MISNLFEQDASIMSLWHGGKGLQFNHMEMLPHKKGRWERGPGLYLTTHYDTAFKYAKGGGTVYLVTVKKGTDIDQVRVSFEDAAEFIKRYAIRKYQKNILDDLKANELRSGSIPIAAVSNLCFNYDALSSANTVALRKYLISHGVDYEIVKNFGGRAETVIVVYNPEIIQNVKPTRAKDISVSDWEKPI